MYFILGAPFSGARRLMHALNRHPSICATENQLFGSFFDARSNSLRAKGPRITFDRYAQSFADHFAFRALNFERTEFIETFIDEHIEFLFEFTRRHSGKTIIVDTIVPYPGTSRRIIDTIQSRFPSAKMIYLKRDGREVATEATFDALLHNAHGTDRYSFFVEHRPNVVLDRFFDDHALKTWGTNWAEAIAIQPRLASEVLQIEYMELQDAGSEALARILDYFEIGGQSPDSFCDLKPGELTERPSTRHFRDFISVRQNDWRTLFTQRDAKVFEEVAGRQLRRAEYESNQDWASQLPDKLALSAPQDD